jgi:hypothetical protein
MKQATFKTKISRENGLYDILITESDMTVSLGKFEDQAEALMMLMEYKRMRSKNRLLRKTERTWANIIHRQESRNAY